MKYTDDSLGTRMKEYESRYTDELLPLIPVICRLDGKAFHTFTYDLKRPYDVNLSNLMRATTIGLVQETNALIGYTQSDEITLIWQMHDHKSDIYMKGRIQKIQ